MKVIPFERWGFFGTLSMEDLVDLYLGGLAECAGTQSYAPPGQLLDSRTAKEEAEKYESGRRVLLCLAEALPPPQFGGLVDKLVEYSRELVTHVTGVSGLDLHPPTPTSDVLSSRITSGKPFSGLQQRITRTA